MTEDHLFLSRFQEGDEASLKLLIDRYAQPCFALILHLIGGDRDQAYDAAVQCFVETVHAAGGAFSQEESFLSKFAEAAVHKCRAIRALPAAGGGVNEDAPAGEKKMIGFLVTALQALSFEQKAFLLLRDHFHLSHREIGKALGVPEKDSKMKTELARNEFRRRLSEVV